MVAFFYVISAKMVYFGDCHIKRLCVCVFISKAFDVFDSQDIFTNYLRFREHFLRLFIEMNTIEHWIKCHKLC